MPSLYGKMTNQNLLWSKEEKSYNVRIIASYFQSHGWTKEAICGMLGNMEDEGLFNPGQWQIGYPMFGDSSSIGFGLVQWTPWWKYTDWVDSIGGDIEDWDLQLDRIQYELENGLQWEMRAGYDISFADYVTLEQDLDYMTRAFFWCYEYGTWFDSRITNANYWWNFLYGDTPPPPVPPPTPTKTNQMPIMFFLKPKWKRG